MMNLFKRGEPPPHSGWSTTVGRASVTPPAGAPPRHAPIVLVLMLVLVSPMVADEPSFSLIGNVAQKATWVAPAWDTAPGLGWSFTTDLKPKFTAGPVVFQADATWTLPLTASLTPAAPTVTVAEAYFRLTPAEGVDLTLGQKRFNLGVGQTFTVGDSLNPVIGFFDQKTGFRGATAEWSPVSWASVSGAISADKGTVESPLTTAGQVSLLIDQWQVTVSAVGRRDVTFNPALGLSYDLAGIILTAEGAAEFLPQGVRPSGPAPTWKVPTAWNEPAVSGSLGARWEPSVGDWDLTFSAEVLHWAQGWSPDETDAWKKASPSPLVQKARADLPLRSRENAFFRVGAGTDGLFTMSTFLAADLQDQSWLGQVQVVWTPWDNLDLTATLQTVSGQAGSSWEFVSSNKDRYQATISTIYHY